MILCCGEALIDMLPVDDAATAYRPATGGAVFNTAVALARLGVQTGFFGGLSTDLFGDRLRAALAESGVDSTLCHVNDRPSMLAFVSMTDGQARYSFYDEGTAGRMILAEDLPDLSAGTLPDLGFFGGISLAQEPCGTTCEVLFHRLAKSGVPLMLDPNIRPGFIRHERAYRKRLERMIDAALIVKLSDEDLTWLAGPGSMTARCEALLARGPSLVVVTQGAGGACAHTGAQEVFVAAPHVDVVDTVGAGDTFNAGLLASLQEQDLLNPAALSAASQPALQAAMGMAGAAAAITVSRAGANPPWRRELP